MPSKVRIDELPSTSVPEAVIFAVAEALELEALELPPLGENLNPIALELLLDDDAFVGHVTFEYAGCEVSVNSNDVITVSS